MQFLLHGNPTVTALWASVSAVTVVALFVALSEPLIAHGDQVFLVNQEIQSEIAFLSDPGDVLMDNPLSGITGGQSFGTTTFNVSTNNANGYTVTLAFSSTTAMNSTSSGAFIPNYNTGDANGDWDMSVSSGQAFFAYTVYNETTPDDADPTFLGNGSNSCDTGSVATIQRCWFGKADATVAETIIDGGPTAGTGATTSVIFQVQLGSNSGVQTGWYQATGTLTAAIIP